MSRKSEIAPIHVVHWRWHKTGTFSQVFRYRDKGKEANVANVEQFGAPSHSLFISTNFLSFKQKTKIEEEDGSVAYRAKSRSISLHDKTTISNAHGDLVATIENEGARTARVDIVRKL